MEGPMKKVEYLGPDEFFSFVWAGAFYTFERGKQYDLTPEVADQCLMLNPRGLTVETANNYGAKVFLEVGPKKIKGGE